MGTRWPGRIVDPRQTKNIKGQDYLEDQGVDGRQYWNRSCKNAVNV